VDDIRMSLRVQESMSHPANAARDRRRAEARILRAARQALLKEMEVEAAKTRPDADRLAFLSTKARKIEASLVRHEEKPQAPAPKPDGRTQAERLKKDDSARARYEKLHRELMSLPLFVLTARMKAREDGLDPDLPENAEAMKKLTEDERKRHEALDATAAERLKKKYPHGLPSDEI
jgi:hypothetical protein